jgi:hypothetical protein
MYRDAAVIGDWRLAIGEPRMAARRDEPPFGANGSEWQRMPAGLEGLSVCPLGQLATTDTFTKMKAWAK